MRGAFPCQEQVIHGQAAPEPRRATRAAALTRAGALLRRGDRPRALRPQLLPHQRIREAVPSRPEGCAERLRPRYLPRSDPRAHGPGRRAPQAPLLRPDRGGAQRQVAVRPRSRRDPRLGRVLPATGELPPHHPRPGRPCDEHREGAASPLSHREPLPLGRRSLRGPRLGRHRDGQLRGPGAHGPVPRRLDSGTAHGARRSRCRSRGRASNRRSMRSPCSATPARIMRSSGIDDPTSWRHPRGRTCGTSGRTPGTMDPSTPRSSRSSATRTPSTDTAPSATA